MKRYLILAVLPFFLSACSKSGSNSSTTAAGITNGIVQTAAGAYVIAGTISTIGTNCGGATSATVTAYTFTGAYSVDSYGNQVPTPGGVVGSAAATVGQAFSFGVSAGTYVLIAVAGTCQTSPVAASALTNGSQGFIVCLGQSCSTSTGTGYTYGYPYSGYYKAASTSTLTAAANSSNISQAYPGTGDLQLNSSVYLSVKKVTPFDLNVDLTSGNTMITSAPGLAWNGSVAGDGSIKVGEASVDHLSYSAQVDASLLQYDTGFCDTSSAVGQKAADYLTQAGFAAASVKGFQSAWTAAALTGTVCVYPQDATSIAHVSTYKTASTFDSNRVWFVVTSDSTQSANGKKMSEKIAKLISRPKTDALAALKKNNGHRQIASDSDILSDEWALGFVIQK